MPSPTHGGKRPGAGRPKTQHPLETHSIRITAALWAKAKRIGETASDGVRLALEAWKE